MSNLEDAVKLMGSKFNRAQKRKIKFKKKRLGFTK